MRVSHLLVSALLLVAPLAGFAVPTGLNIMPTAESLASGQSRLDFESDGSGKLYVPPNSSIIGSQTGFVLGFEGGVDTISGESAVYNLKWCVISDGLLTPAIAIGAQNVKHGEKTQYYLVATKSLLPGNLLAISAGSLRNNEDKLLTMIGAKGRLGPFTAKVDHVEGGSVNRSALGLSYTYREFSITGTLYRNTDIPDEKTITLSYTQGIF